MPDHVVQRSGSSCLVPFRLVPLSLLHRSAWLFGDTALNRHWVTQLALRLPQMLDELRTGTVHLTGLFLLATGFGHVASRATGSGYLCRACRAGSRDRGTNWLPGSRASTRGRNQPMQARSQELLESEPRLAPQQVPDHGRGFAPTKSKLT